MIVISKSTANRLSTILFMGSAITALCIGPSAIAADNQTTTVLSKEISALEHQIRALNGKVQCLETSQAQTRQIAAETAAAQSKMTPTSWTKGPDGYISVPGTNTAIRIGGRVRGEMMYDGGPNMGDYMAPQTIPLKGINNASSQSGNTNASARGSRLEFASLTPTSKGDVKTFVQIDFFGGGSGVGTGSNYNPRLRHAYGTFSGFLVGQTESVFLDVDSLGSNIDANGILGGALRQMQIRYTKELKPDVKFMTAIEKPNSDYIGSDGTLYTSNDATSAKGKSSLPDLTAQLRWTGNAGYIAARGMVRQIQYRSLADVGGNANSDFSAKATAWGAGLSGKFVTVGKSGITGQINTGRGIGRYIPEIAGEAAYFNSTTKLFNVLTASNFMIGYEHYWTDNIRSNLQASYTKVSSPKNPTTLTGTTRITSAVKKAFFNILYTPVKNIETGVEFAHIRRDTIDNKTGSGNRVSFAVTYSF